MIDYFIFPIWEFGAFILAFISLNGNNVKLRLIAVSIFVIFSIVAALKSFHYPGDTAVYVEKYNLLKYITWNDFFSILIFQAAILFEFFRFFLSRFFDANIYLILMVLIPTYIFAREFIVRKYHPVFIFLIYTIVSLPGSLTMMRQYIAIALIFLLINKIFYKEKIHIIYWIIPLLIHASSIVIIIFLNISKINNFKNMIFFIVFFLIAVMLFFSFFESIINALFYYTQQSRNNFSFDVRGLVNLVLLFLIGLKFRGHYVKFDFMDSLLILSFFIVFTLLFFPQLARLGYYFNILVIAYMQYKYKDKKLNFNELLVWFITVINLGYFVFIPKVGYLIK